MRFFLILFLFCFVSQNYAQTVTIKPVDAEGDTDIDFYTVLVAYPTDTVRIPHDGSFTTVVPLKRFPVTLIIQATGYENDTLVLEQLPQDRNPIVRRMMSSLISCPVIVQALGSQSMVGLGTYTIARDEALRLPAAFFDPARAASTRPGVLQTNDGTNALSIHGLHPELMRWRLHGLEIVNPNHLPNAGTLSDRSAQGAGGVYLVSSQALGATQLHTGTMNAGVGDAVAGVLDITLRDGDAQLRRTFQAGLLGLDAAISGKIRRDNLRYLVNYRYSTVGLLNKLGVSFGDEAIAFQDINANLVYYGPRQSAIRAFALGGRSTNDLNGDTTLTPLTLRNFSEINFKSQSAIFGVHALVPFAEGWHIETGSAWSGQLNTRREQACFLGAELFTDRDEHARLSGNLIVRKTMQKRGSSEFSAGVLGSHLRLRQMQNSVQRTDLSTLTLQPFSAWRWSGMGVKSGVLERHFFQMDLGLHNLYAPVNQSFVTQPRARVSWRPHNRTMTYSVASGRYAQMPLWNSFGTLAQSARRDQLTPMTAWHHTVSASRSYYKYYNRTVRAALFYQGLANIPVESATGFRSPIEGEPVRSMAENRAIGRSYGADLSIGWERQSDFRYEANVSIFDTRFRSENTVYNARYNTGFVSNLLAEKSWKKLKKHGRLTRSASARFVLSGGQYLTPVQVLASQIDYATQYDYRNYSSKRGRTYYRTDVRFQRSMAKTNQRIGTFAFEIQNLSLRKNDDFEYYDTYSDKVLKKTQLGMIPNLNWRYEW
jgi:hypothetical protein